MCNSACIQFASVHLTEDVVRGKTVIEVGSMDVNGSVRSIVEALGPARYIGVDLCEGPGVDMICAAEDLVDVFGCETFDLLISSEMLEHVREWKCVIRNFKRLLRPHGYLFATTRSKGFFYHDYPHDFWRYELEDMKDIFSDFNLLALESDPLAPGIFMLARKPDRFIENDLAPLKLYSMIKFRRADSVSALDMQVAKTLYSLRRALSKLFQPFRKKTDGISSGDA